MSTKAGQVYFASADSTSQPKLYIGEADPVIDRLERHEASRDFWTSALCFVSSDDSLSKGPIQYVEFRLLQEAIAAKRVDLQNKAIPTAPTLGMRELTECKGFVESLLKVVRGLNYSFFTPLATSVATTTHTTYELNEKGITAHGYPAGDGFVILKGSTAVPDTVPSMYDGYLKRRRALIKDGVLQKNAGGNYVFTRDEAFDAPSVATCIILGNSSSPYDRWKDDAGATLRESTLGEG